jgi:hypothetical protein
MWQCLCVSLYVSLITQCTYVIDKLWIVTENTMKYTKRSLEEDNTRSCLHSSVFTVTLVHLHSFTALCVPIIRYPSFVRALLCSLVTISLPPSPALSPPRRARASDASFWAFLFFCSFFIAAPMSSRSRRS